MSKVRVGLRVIRGPDWQYKKQDGGEGHTGTVVYAPKPGSSDEKVTVLWDVGMERRYRAGQEGKYDLVAFDNAQTEIKHDKMRCWSCKENPILGMRWTCEDCRDLHLCTACYMGNKHEVKHGFLRVETPASQAVPVGPRSSARRIPIKGIFEGAVVNRGPHWKWDNEDGGEGDPGTVLKIQTWGFTRYRSAVQVRWDATGKMTSCRVGADGFLDVTYFKASKLGDFYVRHLPVVDLVGSGEVSLKNSDKVIVQLTEAQFRRIDGSIWCEEKRQCLHETGTIVGIQVQDAHVMVQYEDGQCWDINRQALTRVHRFCKEDAVRIISEENVVKGLQEGHGGWNYGMQQTLGKAGRVRRIGEDGDMLVKVGTQSWVFSPVTCTPLNETDNVEVLPNLTKSELELEERDDLRKLRDKVNGFDESYASLMVDYNNDVDKQPDETVCIEALIEATRTGDVDKVKTIIRQNPSLVNTQCRHETALHIAAYEKHEEIVKLLLKQGASVNSFDDDRDTALHFSAFGDSAACMQLLLDHNARVDAQNKDGFTCLHITVGKTNLDCTKILLEAGASPNIKDKEGATPMHEVIIQRKRQAILVSYLFGSAKADFTVVNSRGFNVLQWAALKDCLPAVKEILERKPEMKDTQMKEGYTALHICAANGHVEIANELMKARANKEMEDSEKRTPLILAVMQGRTKMVELLINEHCNVDHVDNEGNTALHHAQASRQMSDTEARRLEVSVNNDEIGIELMSLLIKAGAKIDIRNNKGQTVMDLCREEDVREFISRVHHMATIKIYPMSDGKAVLPTHWDAFPENKHVHVVTLDSTRSGLHQRELQDVKNKFCKTLTQKRIISVERIQNKFLWEHYFYKRVNMDRALGPGHLNEFDLYHGTGPDIVEGIIANNVDVRLAGDKVGTKLGLGSYFARDAKLSDGYADPDANGHKFMFQVRVLCGRWTHGQPDLTRPPKIDPANPKSRLYDCCVDNDRNPYTFCLFDQNQYYPEYLIEYT